MLPSHAVKIKDKEIACKIWQDLRVFYGSMIHDPCISCHKQRIELRDENGDVPDVQDIGCCSMILGMIFGVGSLVTLGLVTCCCNIPEVSGGISLPVLPSLALGSLFLAALGAVPLGMSRRRIGFRFRVGYLRLLLLVALVPDYPGSLAGDCHGVLPLRLSPGFCIFLVVQLLASAIWPAYVTAGWLRYAGPRGGRRRHGSTCSAMSQGVRASYQLLWANDVITNLLICQACTCTSETRPNLVGDIRFML